MLRKILLSVFIISALTITFSQEEAATRGKRAPNFKLEDLDDNIIELKSLLGKGPILISFWATWCKPCVEELAEYSKIFNEYSSRGLQMLAISTDNEKSVSKVKPFVKSKQYNFPVLLDTNSEVARKYQAQAVPYTVILRQCGSIVYSHLGYMKGDEIEVKKKIDELLKSANK